MKSSNHHKREQFKMKKAKRMQKSILRKDKKEDKTHKIVTTKHMTRQDHLSPE